jgi:copper oxidase (laccase) domain-containing protein
MEWRENEGVRWLEADLGGARAAFSTRLAGALGREPEQVVFALQVHGTRLLRHSGVASGIEADGHVVTEPGLVPLVFVADCLLQGR